MQRRDSESKATKDIARGILGLKFDYRRFVT